jgi:hypothetical protein
MKFHGERDILVDGANAVIARGSLGGTRQRTVKLPAATGRPPRWFLTAMATVPPRDELPPASPRDVIGLSRSGHYASAPIKLQGSAYGDPKRTFVGVDGVTLQPAVLSGQGTELIFGAPRDATAAQKVGVSKQAMLAEGKDPGIYVSTSPGGVGSSTGPVTAPNGMTWGDPRHDCGGRSSSDSCFGCCDSKQGTVTSAGAAIGAVAGLAAVGVLAAKGALVGAAAGPAGAAVGALAGCVIGFIAGYALSTNCYSGCSKLFPSPDLAGRTFNLTSVAKGDGAIVLGYVGRDDAGHGWALSMEEAVAAVEGGLQVRVVDSQGDVRVTVVRGRRPAHLRSVHDKRKSDNISELPVVVGLPDVRGIDL